MINLPDTKMCHLEFQDEWLTISLDNHKKRKRSRDHPSAAAAAAPADTKKDFTTASASENGWTLQTLVKHGDPRCKLFITNLDLNVLENDLREMFLNEMNLELFR